MTREKAVGLAEPSAMSNLVFERRTHSSAKSVFPVSIVDAYIGR